jgi:hypothetical protein
MASSILTHQEGEEGICSSLKDQHGREAFPAARPETQTLRLLQ